MANLSQKDEGIFAVVAALVVLISAMWDPWISAIIAIVALLFFAEQSFSNKKKK
ncbi:hypothetical protein J4411_03105 [Candidatus Pacearchaeota archaeon]|nr:hypothetical protein [Candidatus Pacearchaeota archaeon]